MLTGCKQADMYILNRPWPKKISPKKDMLSLVKYLLFEIMTLILHKRKSERRKKIHDLSMDTFLGADPFCW